MHALYIEYSTSQNFIPENHNLKTVLTKTQLTLLPDVSEVEYIVKKYRTLKSSFSIQYFGKKVKYY